MTVPYVARRATPDDASAITRIYNEGIDGRLATFEIVHRTPDQVAQWFDGTHPIVVVTRGDLVVGFASTSAYRPRPCYAGIAEFSVYVHRDARGRGVGRALLARLIEEARTRGYWKLLSRVFPTNTASLGLCRSLGFRDVGTYERHGQLDGRWLDVVIVERLIPENQR